MMPYTEVKNLDLWKKWLKNWVDSGQYSKDIHNVLIPAYTIVDAAVGNSMAAVVFDIDETMISEYSLMLKYDFGWTEDTIDEAQLTTTFPAIMPVLNFYNYCFANNINVFVITSKRYKYMDSVYQELEFAEYREPTQLFLRPDNDTGTIADYKARTRETIINNGYDIIANIGDQPSDFYKGYADNDIIIPNLFYDISIEMIEEYVHNAHR